MAGMGWNCVEMAGMARNGWNGQKWLGMVGCFLKRREMAGIPGHGCKWLKVAEMAGVTGHDCKWLEVAAMVGNDCTWLLIAENCCKWLYISRRAVHGMK